MKCANCNEELNDWAKFCPKCGTKVEPKENKNICPQCGAETKPGAKFCSECGAPLPAEEKDAEPPKENTDEEGKKAWEELKAAVREKYEIDEEEENSMTLFFEMEEDKNQMLLLEKRENGDNSEIWLEISSPIGDLNSLDFEEACQLAGSYLCGGIVMYEDISVLRTCMPMAKANKEAVFRIMGVICNSAYEIRGKFADEEEDG